MEDLIEECFFGNLGIFVKQSILSHWNHLHVFWTFGFRYLHSSQVYQFYCLQNLLSQLLNDPLFQNWFLICYFHCGILFHLNLYFNLCFLSSKTYPSTYPTLTYYRYQGFGERYWRKCHDFWSVLFSQCTSMSLSSATFGVGVVCHSNVKWWLPLIWCHSWWGTLWGMHSQGHSRCWKSARSDRKIVSIHLKLKSNMKCFSESC